MEAKGWLMVRVLLNRSHQGSLDKILRLLPQNEVTAILAQDVKINDPRLLLEQPSDRLQQIHYSWLVPIIKQMPPHEQTLFLAALSDSQAASISKIDSQMIRGTPPAPCFKQLILKDLVKHLSGLPTLPLACMPKTPLSVLADLSKEQLIELADLMGTYDLANEVRRIVDKNQLNLIYKMLSPQKQQFLRKCLPLKDKIQTPPLQMAKLLTNKQLFEKAFHRRGLARIALALSQSSSDFIWYIAHKLDTGRGTILLEQSKIKAPPSTAEAGMHQLLETIKREL